LEEAMSHYEVLDVHTEASSTDIRAAYKRQALSTHPDKGGISVEFQKVLEAFQTLSDTTRRRQYDQQQSKIQPAGVRCARRRPDVIVKKLAQLLQRMSAGCRRQTILSRLNHAQRAALEKHLRGEKDRLCPTALVQHDARDSCGTGIYRCTRKDGYYAKVFAHSIALQGFARKDLAEAINDNIGLTKIINHLRSTYFCVGAERRIAPSSESSGSGLPLDLVASFQVFFYCRHFIGHRHLQLNFKTLHEGLAAWEAMQKARGSILFSGQGVTDAYTPCAALDQWRRIKDVYLQLSGHDRDSSKRLLVEKQLLAWEREHRPIRMRRERTLWQRQLGRTAKRTHASSLELTDASLLRRVEQLLNRKAKHREAKVIGDRRRCAPKRSRKSICEEQGLISGETC
jgi:hypothetical protein